MPSDDPPDKSQRLVPLRVEPIEHESLSFHVESEGAVLAEGETWVDHAYRVDLETLPVVDAHGNAVRNSSCTCRNFECRMNKVAESGQIAECKHILSALVFYARIKVVEESNNRKRPMRRTNIFQGLKQ
jgi:hypothetical protein